MEKEELERLVETEQRSKSNTKRLGKLELKVDDIHNLALSVQAIATEMKAMREDMTNIDNRVLAIEAKPSKKLDSVWGIVVSALISGIIAFIFVKLGMK
mgnify:FL=1